MQNELITVAAYCNYHHTELSFIDALEKSGLLTITVLNNERCIDFEQLQQLECYTRLYYEMEINVPGIDAINNLLDKVRRMQQEIDALRQQLTLYRVATASL